MIKFRRLIKQAERMRYWYLLILLFGYSFLALAKAKEDEIYKNPADFGEVINLQEYLVRVMEKSLERQAADLVLETAVIAKGAHYNNYLPRPSVTASQSANVNRTLEDRTVSRSQSAGLQFTGNTPIGMTWGIQAPSISRSRTESGSFGPDQLTHQASMGVNVAFQLLSDSYFVVGRKDDTRAELNYKKAKITYRLALLNLTKTAQAKYFDVIFRFLSIRIKQAALNDAMALLENTKIKVKEGENNKLSILHAELQVARSQNEMVEAEEAFQKAYQQFLQGIDPERTGENLAFPDLRVLDATPKEPKISLQKAVEKAKKNQPDYVLGRINLYLQKIQLREARSKRWPSLQLTAKHDWLGSDQGGWEALSEARRGETKQTTVGLTFSYVPWNNPADESYRATLLGYRQASATFDQNKINLVTMLTEKLQTVKNAYRRLEISELALRISKEKLSGEKFRYDEGETTIKDVIDVQNEYDNTNIELLRSRSAVISAITELRALIGLSYLDRGEMSDD